MKKRILSVLLVLAMVLSVIPFTVFATVRKRRKKRN